MKYAIIQAEGKRDLYFQKVQKPTNAKIVAWEMENIFNVKVIAIFYVKLKPLTLGNLKYF